MKRIFLAGVFCFQLFVAAAQSYEPGYIVPANEDTIFGYLPDLPDSELAKKVLFRKNIESIVETFTPMEIEAFGFNDGRNFISRTIFKSPNKPSKNVFAKNLMKGKIDLYIYNHPQRYKPDFFLINNASDEEVHLKRPEVNPADRDQRKTKLREKAWQEDLQRILEDSVAIPEKLRYSEKTIKEYILKYNEEFEEIFPIEIYNERNEYDINILVGIPIRFDNEIKSYRVAVFIEKYNPERKNYFTITRGIIYHHDRESKDIPVGLENGEFNYKTQLLNLIPVAVKFQGGSKIVGFYGYAGVGAAVVWEENIDVENGSVAGLSQDTKFIPTVNAGVGVKVYTGAQAFIAELTPTLNGIFVNLGFSF